MNLPRPAAGNKKGFSKYLCVKEKTRENVVPLLNEAGDLVTQDMENTGVLTDFFASVFTSKNSLEKSQVPETEEASLERRRNTHVGRELS